MSKYNLQQVLKELQRKNPGQHEFHQAAEEILQDIIPYINEHDLFLNEAILERLLEPERVIIFQVVWRDDKNRFHVNRGYRVQFNSAIGPYKGGLRFHPTVDLSILKFLGFEQIFKNALTGLPMGGGKGGSNFDPKGKSDREIMNFCQAFMSELFRYIGPDTDVPAGDIGVGSTEIGYLYGQYKKINNAHEGVLTGKGVGWGGSNFRTEATGYCLLYFTQSVLRMVNEDIRGKRILISGSGNVALHAAEKAIELGGQVLTLSDSSGYIIDNDGIDREKLEYLKDLKLKQKARIKAYLDKYPEASYHANKRPWGESGDIALPCATQNEIEKSDAELLVKNGVKIVAEGANMPSSREDIKIFHDHEVLFAPGKAANAGGVAVSGLEMAQNATHSQWAMEEVDLKAQEIMRHIFEACKQYGQEGDKINLSKGANIAGFIRVAEALVAQGVF